MHVLKHCITRWLSLDRTITRLLALWPALNLYFDQESEVRVKKTATLLGKFETKIYANFDPNFISFALKPLSPLGSKAQICDTYTMWIEHVEQLRIPPITLASLANLRPFFFIDLSTVIF